MSDGRSPEFGDLLRRHRLDAGLTQEELAERAGLSARGLSDLERGARRVPHPETVRRLAEALKLAEVDRAALLAARRRSALSAGQPSSPTPAPPAPGNGGDGLDGAPPTLPVALTSFVGREGALVETRRLLANTRLLTLVGPGGIGKTRLAVQAAALLADGPPGEIWFVDLAPLDDGALLPQTVLASLGVRASSGLAPVAAIAARLRDRAALLLLDSCEHLVDACAQLAEALLRACPDLRILATSREPLGVSGEVLWRVPPLSTPRADAPTEPETLHTYAAARLFAERARAVDSSFVLNAANGPAVAEICQRLDGIPLALELAAARVSALPVEELAARLGDVFHLVGRGARTAPPRHRTLRAMVDWSHDLLSEPEQRLFRRLATFMGGWSLAAAEAVCGDDGGHGRPSGLSRAEVLDLLASLIEKSLVVVDGEQPREARYRFLDTIRQYAAQKLLASGEAEAVRARHRDYYVALTTSAKEDDAAWLGQLRRERDNVRAVLAWCVERDDAATGLLLSSWRSMLWRRVWSPAEGRIWCRTFLALPSAQDPRLARPRLEATIGLAFQTPRIDPSKADALAEAVELAREIGDDDLLLRTLAEGAVQYLELDDLDAARTLAADAAPLAERVGGRWAPLAWRVGGTVALVEERFDAAQECFERALAAARVDGALRYVAQATEWLGYLAHERGDLDAARRHLAEARAAFEQHGAGGLGVVFCLCGLGLVDLDAGDLAPAEDRLREALAMLQGDGATPPRAGAATALGSPGRAFGNEPARRLLEGLAGAAALRVPSGAGAGARPSAAQARRALRLAGAASALDRRRFYRPDLEGRLARWLAPARALLGPAAEAAAWAEGQAMSERQVVAYALGDDERPRAEPGLPRH